MNYAKKLLLPDENVVRVARDHWVVLLLAVLIDGAISIVIIGLTILGILLAPPWTWFGFLLLIVPIGHLALRVWAWWNKQCIVTDRRIIQITGTFSKRVSDTLLEKINDIVMEQSALGRLLKFGDIEIISGSESGVDVFLRIADPIAFKATLLEQKESLGTLAVSEDRADRVLKAKASGTGDVPELIAELDELRQKGLITDTEFEEKKQQLLDRI
ncbi:MAG: hypothetical protein DRJ03_25160 [Chloroflexi bacterium]|nr:MAG: hypothetical protein B6I35_05475 [Anaerolineaceae bacterium 4572_32.2]RLC73707.1 MAG: hypothetical protein DRI81_14795 [Chloroflexota bacterium]RLC78489.1 MAG: hypothetical protein DRJ03_25160 [Chloroflexota bacterium]